MRDWRARLPLLLGGVAAAALVLLLAVPLAALVWRTLEMGALGPALRTPTVLVVVSVAVLALMRWVTRRQEAASAPDPLVADARG